MKSVPRTLLGLCLLLGSSACEREQEATPKEPAYGDPVGIKMEAAQSLPAFEIAIAVTKGVTIDPLVPSLSGALHKALRACPEVVKSVKVGEPIQIAFAIEQGKTKDAAVAGATMAPCLSQNLSEQTIEGAPPGHLDAIALLRFASADAVPTSKP